MAYEKTNWQDLPNTTTPITAARLNNIESGIENNETSINTITTNLNNLKNYVSDEVIIGTCDDKPLYRKEITFTTALGGGQVATITNLERIINMYGSYNGQSNNFPIQMYVNSDYFFRTWGYGNGIFYDCGLYADYDAEIYVEYTKTTD